MIDLVNNVLLKFKYQKITILADNLDSGWDANSNLELQSLMLCSLIEYVDTLNEQYKDKVKIHSVIFLRKDIFNYIINAAREPDKMFVDIFEINWDKFPEQLKTVLEKRMLTVLNDSIMADTLWKKYFLQKKGELPFNKILKYIVKRPRDAIYFLGRLFESAIYNNTATVSDKDFDYAVNEYTKYLYNNLIAELKAEFPTIDDIIKELQKRYSGLLSQMTLIPVNSFFAILKTKLSKDDLEKFVKTLMKDEYLIAIVNKGKKVITTYEDLQFAMGEKLLFIFHKNKIMFNMRLTPFIQ